jgi:hypothetical protein
MHPASREVAKTVNQLLGDSSRWDRPTGYPKSLALCVIDSIQSIGIRYQGVVRVVNRYRDYRKAQGGDAVTSAATRTGRIRSGRWGGPTPAGTRL